MGLEVGDFGVAEAVGEGGVWVDFLLALGERARSGCCGLVSEGFSWVFVATAFVFMLWEKANYLHATAVPSRPSAMR